MKKTCVNNLIHTRGVIFLYIVFRKIGFARAEGHRRPVPNGQFSNPVTVVLEEIQMLAPFLSKF